MHNIHEFEDIYQIELFVLNFRHCIGTYEVNHTFIGTWAINRIQILDWDGKPILPSIIHDCSFAVSSSKSIRVFSKLDFEKYYRMFVRGYGSITKQLTDLPNKFQWGSKSQLAFEKLKNLFVSFGYKQIETSGTLMIRFV